MKSKKKPAKKGVAAGKYKDCRINPNQVGHPPVKGRKYGK